MLCFFLKQTTVVKSEAFMHPSSPLIAPQSSFPDLLSSCWTRTNTRSMSFFPGGRNLLSPLVAAASSWVAFTSDHSSLVTLRLFFHKKLLLRPCLCSLPRGLSLLSFVYHLLDLSGAQVIGTKRVLLLLPNLQDGHQFLTLYNQTRNILSDFTLEPLFVLFLEVQSLSGLLLHRNNKVLNLYFLLSTTSLISTSTSTASLLLFLCPLRYRRAAAPTTAATIVLWLICSFG
ncbi:hypothetical protein BHM03_00037880 [Ensete ventricosum]|nr:hypothetical protein BHM03_00037880 [Ensete ventricosum]